MSKKPSKPAPKKPVIKGELFPKLSPEDDAKVESLINEMRMGKDFVDCEDYDSGRLKITRIRENKNVFE